MASPNDSDYYVSRKRKLLRDFDKAVWRVRGVFVSRYSEEQTDALIGEARQEYEALIPQLPYIGGKQPFTQFVVSTAWFLAMYRVLKAQGETIEAIGQLIYEVDRAFLKAYPRFLRRFFGHMTFSRRYVRKLRKRAAESHERPYRGDYVYTFVEGDGETFDHGVDYLECATCKFLQQQGAPELGPYLCVADLLYSEALGWGLIRTTTLAEGAEKCDFRFKKGGPTRVAVPTSLCMALQGHNPTTGEWNDSLIGDYLWSNVNVSEAVPDVMTPSSWSLWQIHHFKANPIKTPGHHPTCGNICGRPYMNLSLIVSLYRAVGKDIRDELHGEMLGSVPQDVDVPIIPFSALTVLFYVLPGLIEARWQVSRDGEKLRKFVAETPDWCECMRQQLREIRTRAELVSLWREELEPYFYQCCRMLRGVMLLFFDLEAKLRRGLTRLVGEADANALLSNLSGSSGDMESLGPLVGLSRVVHGEMSHEEYLRRYGHRGPHEMELSIPGPEEDPDWLDQRLQEFRQAAVDVEALLAKQRAEFESAWKRFEEHWPRKVRPIRRHIEQVASAARMREAVRSEVTRVARVVRQFGLRANELTGLGDGIFFLSLDEMMDVLSGDDAPTACISARRETHARYSALPPYPAVIVGRFDPVQWAADPNRRSDFFGSRAPITSLSSDTIKGFAGAAGCVEGTVRRLDSAEEGEQLRLGEVLVTMTTNVGWTPLFPRAAAIVTDVGAPLSHAAIVARELGIPAVVGCGDATMRLHTGDRVLVDGGQGIVRILELV